MKMKKMMFLMLTLFFWGAVSMNAQVRVGGTADPNPNALLDVNKDTITVTGNNTGGLALPRVALTSTTTAAPVGTRFVKGMLVYNTATAGTTPNNVTPGAYYSDGAKWIRVSGSDAPVSGWQLGGNTTADGDFIGAINNKPLVFKINGDTVGYVNKSNVAAWGDKALAKNTGSRNTAVGGSALAVNTTGASNTSVGYASLATNVEGSNNTAVGYAALYVNKTSGNTAVGYESLRQNATGTENVAVGDSALRLSTASGNTAVGYRALDANTTGRYNTALGDSAAVKTTTGSKNTIIGHAAGSNLTTGSNNIAIGDSATFVSATGSNQLNIGNWITGTNGRFRIGKVNPPSSAVLDLNADNTATNNTTAATGGLVLPRIALDTINSQLNGITPVNATVVYNTNTAIKGGPGTGLYMWSGGSTGKWTALVAAVPVSSIALSPSGTVRLMEGNSVTIDASTSPDNATNPIVKWTSDNSDVATVNSKGKITAVANTGSAIITATSVDGSNKSRSINVIVYEAIQTADAIGTNVYNVAKFPDGLGTWMLSNSREGTATATYNGVKYYDWSARDVACPPPYAVPDSTQAANLAAFLATAIDASSLFGYSNSPNFKTGWIQYDGTTGFYGSTATWWTSTPMTATSAYRLAYSTAGKWMTAGATKTHRLPIRCVKP